ncbi:Cell division protein FtsW [hydrothermal vent metagenome]|uniref:peptidoglycan glycosyltransferase n=1 Tax=hydrothermal vent metagenome TaxID=652676 RepID=A0A3B0SIA8_9ZZZZ
MLISRSDRGLLSRWWFTVDLPLMFAVFLLMAIGVLFSLAASPAVADRLGLSYFHFFIRQLIFTVPAILIIVGVSFFDVRTVRRVAFYGFILAIILMVATMVFGSEVKGSRRWLDLGLINFQPSELVKPTFIVIASWFLAEGRRRPDMPGQLLAWGSFGLVLGLLVLQPDFGQSVLICLVWAVLLLIYGIAWKYVIGLAGLAVAGGAIAYTSFRHVASRIDRFLNPEAGDNFQVDTAMRAFENGGLFGTGPGGGTAKRTLPDAHTDFIFAVVGEEFGFIASVVLMALIAFITLRVLKFAMKEGDSFVVLATSGLVSIFSFQAIINMAVNVSLLPAKGMTLPFISYGGSSLLTMSFAMGLVLALTRTRPAARVQSPHLRAQMV